jgi:hypothetical protein
MYDPMGMQMTIRRVQFPAEEERNQVAADGDSFEVKMIVSVHYPCKQSNHV